MWTGTTRRGTIPSGVIALPEDLDDEDIEFQPLHSLRGRDLGNEPIDFERIDSIMPADVAKRLSDMADSASRKAPSGETATLDDVDRR